MKQSVRSGGNTHFPQQSGIKSCVNRDEHSPSTKKVWIEVSDHLISGLISFGISFLEISKGFFFLPNSQYSSLVSNQYTINLS